MTPKSTCAEPPEVNRSPSAASAHARSVLTRLQEQVAPYQRPVLHRSLWQLLTTFPPYLLLCYAMFESLSISYWLTLALALPATGFLVRIFIIQHDCGHGSFFKSRRANDLIGFIAGVLTFTPYYFWRHDHAVHHASSGDLERRGVGDILLLTVEEYQRLSAWRKFTYRLFLNPLVLIGILPTLKFVLGHRFAHRASARRERHSVYSTNLALLAIAALFACSVGLQAYLLIQGPIIVLASSVGVWLFYVQHQFEGTYWSAHREWDYFSAALSGSSYLKLPRVFQWFTASIGYHHVHHVNPRIPNYFLERCHREVPALQAVTTLTPSSTLRALPVKLWHEKTGKLVDLKGISA